MAKPKSRYAAQRRGGARKITVATCAHHCASNRYEPRPTVTSDHATPEDIAAFRSGRHQRDDRLNSSDDRGGLGAIEIECVTYRPELKQR